MSKKLLIFSVFIVASCGLAYELIVSALTSYLLGDSILQFSTIIGCYLFAMGVGAALSKYINNEKLLDLFINVEILIGFIGGISAIFLMMVFFFVPDSFRVSVYIYIFMIGILVGMEVPIVIRILNESKNEFKDMISEVLSVDYLGALFVSLLFPLLMMPYLGINKTAIGFGLCNLAIAYLSLSYFSKNENSIKNVELKKIIIIVLGFGLIALGYYSNSISNFAEKGIYGSEIVYSKNTKYQKIFITQHKKDLRLYLNGNLQFSSLDEHRYHEALVHPVLQAHKNPRNVLILGGGDGLAAREVLKHKDVESITLIDLDGDMTDLFKSHKVLTNINKNSLNDKRVKVINSDASKWLSANDSFFDVIIVDFPDPSNYSLGKLYSTAFYDLLKNHLSENGLGVIQSTSPYFAPRVYWTVYATLKEVGFKVNPYHVYVPSFGDWGFFVISNKGYKYPEIDSTKFKFMSNDVIRDMFVFPKDMPKLDMPINTLSNQNVVTNFTKDWSEVR